jgi:4-diphosphocytidyl-2-C-methyl-D-erythritol kinase
VILPGPDYPAPAKLNLFLHVVGRRPDGYHLLQTAFRFVDFADRLRYQVRSDGLIARINRLPDIPEAEDLCVRAARALAQASGSTLGADIEIDKRIPLGGGLGGGSSDAATTLLVLNKLWETGLSRAALQRIALTLGADVPVFIFGQSSFAEGVGEILQPIVLPAAWYVILTPPVGVSTAEIFAAAELTRNTKPIKLAAFSAGIGLLNDLQPVVEKRYSEVARYLDWLRQFGDARMTGSGACVFCAFTSEQAAQEVIQALPSGMTGFIAAGLDRHPLRELAQD